MALRLSVGLLSGLACWAGASGRVWAQAPRNTRDSLRTGLTQEVPILSGLGSQAHDSLTLVPLISRYYRTSGLPLGEVLKQIPGVWALNTGPTISKPVIRGMYGSRVLTIANGIRQEGQSWGNEHAPEADPLLYSEVNIVRGPAAVRYGADALGGAVVLQGPPALRQVGSQNTVLLSGFSNGRGGVSSFVSNNRLPFLIAGQYPFRLLAQGTLKTLGDVETPAYVLGNTGVREQNGHLGLGADFGTWSLDASYTAFQTQIGIFRGAHIGNQSDLLAALRRPESRYDYPFSYSIQRPYQDVSHQTGTLKLSKRFRWGNLQAQYARQRNERLEYDVHRPRGSRENLPQLRFLLNTDTWEGVMNYTAFRNWTLSAGYGWQYQGNVTEYQILIPNFEQTTQGLWSTARYASSSRLFAGWEFGARYEVRDLNTYRLRGSQVLQEDRHFAGWTAHSRLAGLAQGLLPSGFPSLSLDVASTFRTPNVSELYSNGVHHGTASFEAGDPNLQAERSWNASLVLETPAEKTWAWRLEGFVSQVDNFIYLQPQFPQTVLTVRGAFPFFRYQQGQVRFHGLEGNTRLTLTERWSVDGQVALIRAWNETASAPLIFTPGDRIGGGIRYGNSRLDIRLSYTHIERQTRVPENVDFAPTPASYGLLGCEASYTFRVLGDSPWRLSLIGQNLLDTRYREYLNRMRYFAWDQGRNLILSLRIPLNWEPSWAPASSTSNPT